ncbi:MAG: hypothetical protein E6H75_06725 [Betaproteobacteria bacterium]|nr:MAG: hypothetical protein E6H80_04935 [Betaproteobacteria bacterium]TMG77230.1 MAG: hypothetical protein E6H75_06725 [Betaproteobacteria bacterium]
MGRVAKQPRITIVGVYSPKASRGRLERFIKDHVKGTKTAWAEMGLKATDSGKRLTAIASELRSALGPAALIEALVENADKRFDPGDFVQQDSAQPEGHWQVAWEEVFLTTDGEKVLFHGPAGIPKRRSFRIAFYIHFWKHGAPLLSTYGPVQYPQPTPIPERLWRLAPYALVD